MGTSLKSWLTRGSGPGLLLVALLGVFAFVLRQTGPGSSFPDPADAPGGHRNPQVQEEFDLGRRALEARDFGEAFDRFTAVLELAPDHAAAHFYRGGILFGRQALPEALAEFSEAIRLDPQNAAAHVARATLQSQRGHYDDALRDLDAALAIDPDDAYSLNNRAFVYRQTRQFDLAIADYEEALRLSPDHDAPAGGLAWILATCPDAEFRDGPRAVTLATQACEASHWRDRIALETLAAAYAETQNFPEAIQRQQAAIELLPDGSQHRAECQQRLERYQQQEPWRDGP